LQEVLIGISGTQQKPPGFPDGLFVSQTSFAILRRRTAVTTIPRGGAGCRSSSPNQAAQLGPEQGTAMAQARCG